MSHCLRGLFSRVTARKSVLIVPVSNIHSHSNLNFIKVAAAINVK